MSTTTFELRRPGPDPAGAGARGRGAGGPASCGGGGAGGGAGVGARPLCRRRMGEAAGWRSDAVPPPGPAAALFGERALPIAGAGRRWWRSSRCTSSPRCSTCPTRRRWRCWVTCWTWPTVCRGCGRWCGARVPVHLARGLPGSPATCPWLRPGMRTGCWSGSRVGSTRTASASWSTRPGCTRTRTVRSPTTTPPSRNGGSRCTTRGAPGTSAVFMTLDTADAVAFDHTVSTMAATIGSLGHEGDPGRAACPRGRAAGGPAGRAGPAGRG